MTITEERSNKSWNFQKFDENIRRTILFVQKSVNLGQKIMLCIFIVELHLISLKPFFDKRNMFIVDILLPKNSIVADTVILFCQYYVVCVTEPILFSYDYIYVSSCTDLALQVFLLKMKIKYLPFGRSESVNSEIKECAVHHQYLLK